jgi:hypothetical protein
MPLTLVARDRSPCRRACLVVGKHLCLLLLLLLLLLGMTCVCFCVGSAPLHSRTAFPSRCLTNARSLPSTCCACCNQPRLSYALVAIAFGGEGERGRIYAALRCLLCTCFKTQSGQTCKTSDMSLCWFSRVSGLIACSENAPAGLLAFCRESNSPLNVDALHAVIPWCPARCGACFLPFALLGSTLCASPTVSCSNCQLPSRTLSVWCCPPSCTP